MHRLVSISTTLKSWLTTTAAIPVSSSSPRMRSRTPAATDASNPVVGSSRMSTGGLFASAFASCTRCLIPPEKVWTGSSIRFRGTSVRWSNSVARSLMSLKFLHPAAVRRSAILPPAEILRSSPSLGS